MAQEEEVEECHHKHQADNSRSKVVGVNNSINNKNPEIL
jgi:hypothetical protein